MTQTSTLFDINNVKVLHLEPTTRCNAACPQCARSLPTFYTDSDRSEIVLADLQKHLPESFIKNLTKMFMCGNFGDPAAAKDSLQIFKWFREVNPSITLGMNTNGGLKTEAWWTELATVFNQPEDYVVFSIDGLSDTNHIYRVNVNWDILMRNAEAFINAGGSAHWDMLMFEHNEHQVQDAIDTARQMKFKWFRSKVTKRMGSFPVKWLSLPSNVTPPLVQPRHSVKCHALNEKSIFIGANLICLPCCFMGDSIFRPNSDIFNVLDFCKINLADTNLGDIIQHFNVVADGWKSTPLAKCLNTCGVSDQILSTQFDSQWRNEIQL